MSKAVSKAGRPTAIVPDVVAKLEEALKDYATVEQACAYAGINKATYYRQIKENEDFATKMDRAKYYTTLKSKRNIAKAVDEGDLATSKWHLEKTEYNQPQVQINTQVNFQSQLEEGLNDYVVEDDKL